MRQLSVLVGILAGVLLTVLPGSAQATLPGENGRIAVGGCGPLDCGLFVKEPDGTRLTQLTHNPHVNQATDERAGDTAPAWSPRGDRIAFERGLRNGNPEIYITDADGTDVRGTGVSGNDPTWSPDGTKLAFWSFGGTFGSNGIFVMNTDGTGVTRIHQGVNPRGPDWSPDGSKIAFGDSSVGGSMNFEIMVVPAQGGTAVSLTPLSGPDQRNFWPSWSPDSARVAFAYSSPAGQQKDIYSILSNGTDRQQLTATPETEEEPFWSPDGTRIGFRRSLGPAPSGIVIANTDGTNGTVIGGGSRPAWQPVVADEPVCTYVSAWPRVLYPADKRMDKVFLTAPAGISRGPVAIDITGVTQDEPIGGVQDAKGVQRPDRVLLRAEHSRTGDGRVYEIAFTATDVGGAECTGVVTVDVPARPGGAINSTPTTYDSFTPTASR